ncbi:MAG: hypothetical protein ACRD0U_02810 [Acidimicrobiales bacterium]
MRREIADDLEDFVQAGDLWNGKACAAQIERLTTETRVTGDPLPSRIGRFLEAVRLRRRLGDMPAPLRVEVEAIVYPRLWKVIEGIRDGMPAGEMQTRIEVMNRRLARLFADEGKVTES